MTMLEWARREAELAMADPECDGYTAACCKSALKAFACLTEDGHSGFSISLTKRILVRLIEGKPLTPIADKPEEWTEGYLSDGDICMQAQRQSSLFKTVRKKRSYHVPSVSGSCR